MSDQRETVVVKDGGSGASVILGIIVLIVVLAGAWYLLLGPGATSSDQPAQLDVQIELPSVAPEPS